MAPAPGRLGVALALLTASQGVRLSGPAADEQLAAAGKTIAGVPVRNYRWANHQASGLAELREDAASERRHHAERWILMLKDPSSNEQVRRLCADSGDRCLGLKGNPSDGGIAFVQVHASEADLEGILSKSGHNQTVAFIELDLPTYPIPEAPVMMRRESEWDGAPPWGVKKVGAATGAGKGIHIYILDTGIRTTHEAFQGRAIPTLESFDDKIRECKGDASCAQDYYGHGTHCAGTAGGAGIGVASGATLHAVKIFKDGPDGKPEGYASWSMAGLDWVTTKGQRPAVASMSLGANGRSDAYKDGVERAIRSGITVVVAAGNEEDDACDYSPAFVPAAVTVGAVDPSNERPNFSNFGKCLTLFAPGVDILSADRRSDTGHRSMDGTSMAAPHVAGAVAALLERSPLAAPATIKAYLKATAQKGVLQNLMESPNLLLRIGCPDLSETHGDGFCKCLVGTCHDGVAPCTGIVGENTFQKTCADCTCADASPTPLADQPTVTPAPHVDQPIKGSRRWLTCKHLNMHACSAKQCCCNAGFEYNYLQGRCMRPSWS